MPVSSGGTVPYGGAPQRPLDEGWLRAAFRAVRGVLGLVWAFAPEIIAMFFGVVGGLVLGLTVGIAATAGLFEGGGAWGRAGPVALMLPVFTFLGPVFLFVLFGATVVPTITLAIHAVVVALRSNRAATRQLVVLTTAAAVFVPALLLGLTTERFLGGVLVGVCLGPVTGTFGLFAGATYSGARSVLAGRSLRQWWRDADGSMGVAMMSASVVAWLSIWVPFAFFFLFPVVVAALALAILLGFRLLAAGGHRAVAAVVLVIDLLHAALLAWAAIAVALG